MFFTTERLISSVKRRSLAPSSQQTFTDADIIELANEEMQLSLVPDIISAREDFFLDSKTTALVSGVNHYGMPERAIANSLKDVFYMDANGNTCTLPRVNHHDSPDHQGTASEPSYFYPQGDEVVVLPTPANPTGSLQLWYFSRPNELVPTSEVTKITAIDSAAGETTFTVDTDISAQLFIGAKVDVLSAKSPFLLWAEDAVVTAVNGSTITVSTASVSNAASVVTPIVGDYVCPAQKCNIPMIPQEFHPLLAQMVAARLMEALGDIQKLNAVNSKLGEMRKQAFTLIGNRIESAVAHAVNRRGILSQMGGGTVGRSLR